MMLQHMSNKFVLKNQSYNDITYCKEQVRGKVEVKWGIVTIHKVSKIVPCQRQPKYVLKVL